eukprot:365255-Chlamydomonas_euryale.AAC.22
MTLRWRDKCFDCNVKSKVAGMTLQGVMEGITSKWKGPLTTGAHVKCCSVLERSRPLSSYCLLACTNAMTVGMKLDISTAQQWLRPDVTFRAVKYKFIVDGEWKYDPNQPAMFDEMGNVNNVIEVHEYVPENLDGLSGFEPPPSPPSSYCNPPPVAEDYAKEPPTMPPHLQLTLLNVPPACDAQAVLPRPQHVILSHLYCQRGQNINALVVGTTHRYKSKYVTTVMYKPKTQPP